MKASDFLLGIEAIATLGAFICALYVTVRDGRRIKSGEARTLSDRIATAQLAADHWHETTEGKVLMAQVDRNASRIQMVEERLLHVATKEDIAGLKGSIRGIDSQVKGAAAGVDRIEGLLIKRALNAGHP